VRAHRIALTIWLSTIVRLGAWPHIASGPDLPHNPCENGTIFFASGGADHGRYLLCDNHGWIATDPRTAKIFDVRHEGAKGDGSSDDQNAIAAAAKAAGAHGGVVFFPPGVYPHSGVIDVGTDTLFTGTGPGSVLVGTTYPRAAIRFRGVASSAITDLKTLSKATGRLMIPDSATILFEASHDCSVSRVTIEGGPSAGVMVRSSRAITIDHNEINNTQADGIHVVDGSRDVRVANNVAHNTGDDSFAAVAYRTTAQTDGVVIESNISIQSHARGVACIGAANCLIRGNHIEKPSAHGIAVAHETAYDTYRPLAARVEHNIIRQVQGAVMNPLLISYADDVEVDDLQVYDSTPVYCTHSSRVSLSHLSVYGALTVGVGALECEGFSLLDSRISGSGQGAVRMEGIKNGEISRNILTDLFNKPPDGSGAIDVYRSQAVTGSGNTVSQGRSAPPVRISSSPGSSVAATRVSSQ
jgi:hypothetical protein